MLRIAREALRCVRGTRVSIGQNRKGDLPDDTSDFSFIELKPILSKSTPCKVAVVCVARWAAQRIVPFPVEPARARRPQMAPAGRHHRARETALTKTSIGVSCVGLILLLASPGQAIAEDVRVKACFDRGSNAEQRECLHDLYRAAQAELEKTYRQRIDQATALEADARARGTWPPPLQGPSWAERIASSQKAWDGYREAECWGVIGQPGGSGRLGWAYGCLAEKTFERIDELKVPFDQR
ncbi:DUF1311 domain-containing protein [Bradyrhizobium sp. CCGUVB1N3]|uniref:lysozyme inhibitor LprI family protein n=1 Tax=Bradyrhizobium sp. CCGUVB1N3 TaxID=2949629 RepID=UPI0020B26B9D|nr:lysozyme inhibitor LprI family protein [Bradyrhizobium sp. CCGUVB1N3]MCP3470645.1 DUF1311 domain-containing protein [Bradyrhizobium sp. CCGUVB1N3]